MQSRLAEQAVRGAQALSSQHSDLVKNAVRPFLDPEALWKTVTQSQSLHAWHEHRLANEGSAQLEGGFYGSEVTQAANAAVACGAEVIAADRSKPLSRARLQAAMRHKLEEELSYLEGGVYSARCACIANTPLMPATSTPYPCQKCYSDFVTLEFVMCRL